MDALREEDDREINHHGKPLEVGEKEDFGIKDLFPKSESKVHNTLNKLIPSIDFIFVYRLYLLKMEMTNFMQ